MVKLLVFLIIFLGVIPLGVILARMYPVFRLVFFCMMVFFTSSMLAIHIYPIPDWTGTARGFALTTVDISSAIVLLSMLADPKCKSPLRPAEHGFTDFILLRFCFPALMQSICRNGDLKS